MDLKGNRKTGNGYSEHRKLLQIIYCKWGINTCHLVREVEPSKRCCKDRKSSKFCLLTAVMQYRENFMTYWECRIDEVAFLRMHKEIMHNNELVLEKVLGENTEYRKWRCW